MPRNGVPRIRFSELAPELALTADDGDSLHTLRPRAGAQNHGNERARSEQRDRSREYPRDDDARIKELSVRVAQPIAAGVRDHEPA